MNDEEMESKTELVDVGHYRKLVKMFIDMRRYQTALFWAEKVCVLSQNDPKDVFCQAQCLFLLKEYHRAAHTIRLHALEKSHIPCFNLLLESLYEAKEFNEAKSIINSVDIELMASSLINHETGVLDQSILGSDESKNELMASIYYLKGKIHEATDNKYMAMDCYVLALKKSVVLVEALDALVQHEMLTAREEKMLMKKLPFVQQSSEADAKFITKLYETKLKKYCDNQAPEVNLDETPIGNTSTIKYIKEITEKNQTSISTSGFLDTINLSKLFTPGKSQFSSPSKAMEDVRNTSFCLQASLSRAASIINESQRSHMETPQQKPKAKEVEDMQQAIPLSLCIERLESSTDVMAAEAEKLFYDCEYKKSFKVLNELLKIDPFHNQALTIQIGCLVEFGDYNKLFYVAHKLVDRYPDKAISWYAVGCYYDLIGKSDPARRYLSKATSLDRQYGPAWLAYGHSFAKENEHDQAMAAYFKAKQLMRGCHLPLLYIGVECGLTKNFELAEKFFYQAMIIAPLDVFVLHELGVIKYEYEFYESAEEVFRYTADIVTKQAKKNNEEISSRWEPLFNNLGQCCRKNKKYKDALEYHQQALLLKPKNALTYTAIGFVHALMGNLEEAITYFHKSLGINRDCIVTSTILKTCIEDLMDSENIIEDICSKAESSNKIILPTIDESPLKYNGMKLKFDDYSGVSSTTADNTDSNIIMDSSMDC